MNRFGVFEVFACTLLREIEIDDEEILPVGTDVFGSITPSGHVYLSELGKVGSTQLGPVCCTGAQPGVDFTAPDETLARIAMGSGFECDPNQQGLWRKKPGA